MLLLPSFKISGKLSIFESRSTNWLTFLAASAPFAIAIEQSLSFKARQSFTPSPVIPTKWPLSLRAVTIFFFWSGLTLPKILKLSIISGISSSLTCDISTLLISLIPALLAILETVTGLSPLMILISIHCSLK